MALRAARGATSEATGESLNEEQRSDATHIRDVTTGINLCGALEEALLVKMLRHDRVLRGQCCSRRTWFRGTLQAALVLASLLALEARSQERAARGPISKAAMVCPSRDLERFLDAFGESAEVQRAFTRSPLTMLHLDKSASPEPATIEEQVPSERVKFPVFPSAASRARAGFSMKLQARSPDRVDVTFSAADTDHQLVFTFERGACWRLVRVDDQSL